jgi:ribonuclease HII
MTAQRIHPPTAASQNKPRDLFKFERQARDQGFRFIVGVDEAGRAPLAGPVVAAAVCLKQRDFSTPIRDSKKMTARQREDAFLEIQERAHVGLGIICETVIDEHNILQATFLAMTNAVNDLMASLRHSPVPASEVKLLIDGPYFKSDLPYAFEPIIQGDDRSLSVACASVMAKVTRDRILQTYHRVFPDYGFDRHKGYPTALHIKALARLGPTIIHRKTFKYVRAEAV